LVPQQPFAVLSGQQVSMASAIERSVSANLEVLSS
jgi:hypothetical protein